MKLIQKKLSEITPYENNPRLNDSAVNAVADSIKEFGFLVPIVIDKNYVIVAGHTRYKAAQQNSLEEVPCIMAEDLTNEQICAFRIADNKTGELAEWDEEQLVAELMQIDNIDMSIFGFEGMLIDEDFEEIKEDNFDFELPKAPVSKTGDIYQLGRHRLMCGDSTKSQDVDKLMAGAKISLLFTDPPYNVAFNGRSGEFNIMENDDLSESDFAVFIESFVNVLRNLKIETWYICCNWAFYGILQTKLSPKACIVWAKNVFGLGQGYRHQHEFILFKGFIKPEIKNESDLWEIKKDFSYVHPTQKPIELSDRAIKNSSDENANVLDLFGGSGSTLMACEQNGRSCYVMEIDPRYVDVIIDRWETYTGQKALLIN